MKKLICLLALVMLVSGCATVRTHSRLQQPEGAVLTASIGSTLFRLNKTGDLPNVFGKADLWGGKVDKGFAELRLKAITEDKKLVLQITDVNRSSSETTMDRYKVGQKVKIDIDNEININSNDSEDKTTFEFDTNKEKTLIIGGIKVTFLEVKLYSVVYKLSKEQFLGK